MKMRNIRVLLAYDGTEYCGWQIQKEGRTVQGELERVLSGMHGDRVPVTASGRTDSGVHARGQVINFRSELSSIPAEKYSLALNTLLPEDIRALKSTLANDRFHSRYDAVRRTYRYYISTDETCLPQHRKYCASFRYPLNISRLNACAAHLVGDHDFTAFTVPRDASKSRVRRIYQAAFYTAGPFIVFTITGNAFLWRMVRSIVGTLMEIEKNNGSSDDFFAILKSKDRARAGTTAPARGLFLHKVEYDEQYR